MKNTIRLTERIRCKAKQSSYPLAAQTWAEFVEKVTRIYHGFRITFVKNKARINEGAAQTKLTWVKA